ncbi:hypothetical protein VPHD479_0389 [Vibrio phage D479]
MNCMTIGNTVRKITKKKRVYPAFSLRIIKSQINCCQMRFTMDNETQLVLAKYHEDPESLTDPENVILLTYIVGMQSDQIALLKDNQSMYEKLLTELQHAVAQLQNMQEAQRCGVSEAGIILDPSRM